MSKKDTQTQTELDVSKKESKKSKKDKKKKKKAKVQVAVKEEKKGIPPEVKERMIECKEPNSWRNEEQKITVKDVSSTTKYIYVHDIHDANPITLEERYLVRVKDSRFVVAQISKEDYEYIIQNTKKQHHLLTVVDCAVFPTLSYGFYLDRLTNGVFPTPQEIEEKDKDFRANPTNFHNPSLIAKLLDKGKEDPVEDEISFDDEDDTLDDDEEFEF